MRVSAIIEARMGSKRLPGKVLMDAEGWPLLAHMFQRVSASNLVDTVVLAVPDTAENDVFEEFAKDTPIKVVRGSEDDVLGRVLKAAKATKTDIIVELTGDCPIIDPYIIDMCAGYFICGDWDFVGNVKPRTWPRGMDTRVFRTETLARVDSEVRGDPRESYWREHVSPWIYDRADSPYKCYNITAQKSETCPELNLSVDDRDDYRRVKDIIEALHPGNPIFSIRDALTYLAGLPGYDTLSGPSHIEEVAPWLVS